MIARIQERLALLRPNTRGALWMLIATCFYSASSIISKELGSRVDPLVISFFRSMFGLAVLLPFLTQHGISAFYTNRLHLHLLRGAVGVTSMMCSFYAIVHLPLAESTALDFTKPLFMIFLAVMFLNETVRWRRWTATLWGFTGVIIMVRPGLGAIDPAILVGLAGAALAACSTGIIKKLSETERQMTIMIYFGVLSTVGSFGPALTAWRWPSLLDLMMLFVLGAVSTFGQFCAIRSYHAADATIVVPIDYIRLIFALIAGYVIFNELPDLWSLLGAALIIGATLYITVRESCLGKQPVSGVPPH
ncbi:MAG: DMT family transporter [Alphaproteobacteria bacterium]|nr:DMT family transporter [Alphaproteobacteria bacterium]